MKQLKVSIIKLCMCSIKKFLLLSWYWMSNVLYIVICTGWHKTFWIYWCWCNIGPADWVLIGCCIGSTWARLVPLQWGNCATWETTGLHLNLQTLDCRCLKCGVYLLYIDSQHIRLWYDMLYLLKYMMFGPHCWNSLNEVWGLGCGPLCHCGLGIKTNHTFLCKVVSEPNFESWVNLLDLLFESNKLQESFRI